MKKNIIFILMLFTIFACAKEETSPTQKDSRDIPFSTSFKSFKVLPTNISTFSYGSDNISFNHYNSWTKGKNLLEGGNGKKINLIIREDLQSYKGAINDKFIALNLKELLISGESRNKNLSFPFKILTTNNYELLVFTKTYINQYGYEIFFIHKNTLYYIDCYVLEDSSILLDNIEEIIMSLKLS